LFINKNSTFAIIILKKYVFVHLGFVVNNTVQTGMSL